MTQKQNTKIIWAGDSTVAHNYFSTFPQTGLGQVMHRYLRENVEIVNLAVNGRSTKSWIDEQRMVDAYFQLQTGDFFFIQFGHNDKKKEDPQRYVEAFGEYQENLRKFIHVARNKGAIPVLISPILRIETDEEGQLINSHEDYPQAMAEVAREEDVAFLNLTQISTKFVEAKSVEACRKYFMHLEPSVYPAYPEGLKDNTHLTQLGATVFAGLIAQALYDMGSPYREVLLEGVTDFRLEV